MMRDVRTLGGLLEARAAVAPDRPFVTFESGSVTFGEVDRAANRVANALAGLGLQPGDRAAAMLSNRPEYLATWFGMAKAGVIEVPLNTGLRGDLLAYMLDHSGCGLLVIEERWVDRLETIRAELPDARARRRRRRRRRVTPRRAARGARAPRPATLRASPRTTRP